MVRMLPRPLVARLRSGRLAFAAIDPEVRFIEGKLAATRFAARLAPFRTEADARKALKAAGGRIEEPTGSQRQQVDFSQ